MKPHVHAIAYFDFVAPLAGLPFDYSIQMLPKTQCVVRVKNLIATQEFLVLENLERLSLEPFETLGTYPVIICADQGRLYVIEGHHRIAIAMNRKLDHIPVMMVSTSQPGAAELRR